MIITRNGSKRLFKEVKTYYCLGCKTDLPLNTRKKFYLLNAHGWGYCLKCMREIQQYQSIHRHA